MIRQRIENYSTKAAELVQDAFLSPQEHINLLKCMHSIASNDVPKGSKIVNFVNLFKSVCPNFLTRKVSSIIDYNIDNLPLSPSNLEFKGKIGAGGVNVVFLFESILPNKPSYVLKLPRSKGEKSFNNEMQMALSARSEFEYIQKLFSNTNVKIPDEYYFIAHSIRDKHPIRFALQEFIGTDLRDVFTDISPDELKEILSKNSTVRSTFHSFVNVIDANPDLYTNQIDILGNKNLSIVTSSDSYDLVFLDPHYRGDGTRTVEKEWQIRERVDYLRNVLSEFSDTTS